VTPLEVAARWALVIVVAWVVQIGLVSPIHPWGYLPDIMVVLAVCAGLTGGGQRGAVVGFWVGLLFDAPRLQLPWGVAALAYSLVAFAAGTAQVVVLQSGRAMSMAIVATGSLLGVLLFAIVGQFFGANSLTTVQPSLAAVLLGSAVTGALLSRVGLRVAGWADGPETRSAAE
jgi:rod shape-determining protein MreD